MDAFQWWENLWNPVALPTADLGAEAYRKYQAGEIDFATYQAAAGKAALLDAAIAGAKSDYVKTVNEKYSLDAGSVLRPVADLSKNLLAVLLVAGALYLIVQWKRLEA
ncbi:MAG: hypothetical protein M0Z38_08470 [Deltaproteobacteria bacterium]|nr:hypothetical protein [Deltaproteobacteria bacterium]